MRTRQLGKTGLEVSEGRLGWRWRHPLRRRQRRSGLPDAGSRPGAGRHLLGYRLIHWYGTGSCSRKLPPRPSLISWVCFTSVDTARLLR